MRNIILIVGWVVSWLVFTTVRAADTNVGVLDVQRVTAKTPSLNVAAAKIRKQFAGQEKLLQQEGKALRAEMAKYVKNSEKMQPEERKKWQDKINERQKKLQENQTIFGEKIVAAKKVEAEKIITRLATIVAKIAQKRNLDVVLFKDEVAYNIPMLDITKEVTAAATTKK